MDDLAYWQKRLREAEAELEAATGRSDVNAATRRLMRAKAELKALEAKRPKCSSRGSRAAAASS